VGGSFSSVNGASRNRIARLNPDGSLDANYQNGCSGANNDICSLALQPDGKVVMGGGFSSVNGSYRSFLGRMNDDGSLDASLVAALPGPSGSIKGVAVQPDGKTIIAGDFTSVNTEPRNRIARLNANGGLDTGFLNGLSGPNNEVYCLALQPDGRFLIGGAFSGVNGPYPSGLARLNADASLDTGFLNGMIGADRPVWSLLVQPDGKVLVGGEFGNLNAVPRTCIGRLNPDGSVDTNFLSGQTGANYVVTCLGLQLDGKVLVGGAFSIMNGQTRG
jgi:uncharacterized delta-60 repeat protein